jgi:SAM-dependent methyltransferase
MIIRNIFKNILRPNGKINFLSNLEKNVEILDVGCGNNSPYNIKKNVPNCVYTGIDVGDHNQTKPNLANTYIITTPENFVASIAAYYNKFDVVMSSHNLEHCNDRQNSLEAMLNAVKVGGKIFLSFPCEQSVKFPNRLGTLNYYDDPTHQNIPPNFLETINTIRKLGFDIDFSVQNYFPTILKFIGFILEPFSKLSKKIMVGTWEYYGFESIIIASKRQKK